MKEEKFLCALKNSNNVGIFLFLKDFVGFPWETICTWCSWGHKSLITISVSPGEIGRLDFFFFFGIFPSYIFLGNCPSYPGFHILNVKCEHKYFWDFDLLHSSAFLLISVYLTCCGMRRVINIIWKF